MKCIPVNHNTINWHIFSHVRYLVHPLRCQSMVVARFPHVRDSDADDDGGGGDGVSRAIVDYLINQ